MAVITNGPPVSASMVAGRLATLSALNVCLSPVALFRLHTHPSWIRALLLKTSDGCALRALT